MIDAIHLTFVSPRTVDRTRVADQIRMKYGTCIDELSLVDMAPLFRFLGILKEKENNTDYARMG